MKRRHAKREDQLAAAVQAAREADRAWERGMGDDLRATGTSVESRRHLAGLWRSREIARQRVRDLEEQ